MSDAHSIYIELRDLLAEFYPDRESTYRVVDDARLVRGHISFSDRAIDNWHAILGEAIKTDHIDALLEVVGKAYGRSERYRTLYENYRRVVDGGGRLEWTAALQDGDEPPAPGQPPYKGMEFFAESDAALFFGRETLTTQLVTHITKYPFLVVIGASGSGKSSLVRAGVVPALRRGEPLIDGTKPPTGSNRWAVHIITPTAHPLKELAASLTQSSESVTAQATLMDDFTRNARSLDLYVSRLLTRGSSPRLLLVVDQFEELFTLCRERTERQAFVDNLLTAAAADGRTTLILTLRADFYHHCAEFDNLRLSVQERQIYIGAMTQDELRRAIEEPAWRAGWEFEDGLVDMLLEEVANEPGALPLLSHALLETWKRRRGRTLTIAGYRASGRVRGAIAKTAQTVFSTLLPAQQTVAKNIFLRLTELGEGTQDTRRRVPLQELLLRSADAATVEGVIKTLADARLVTTSREQVALAEGSKPHEEQSTTYVDVAHEALIREWPALREWLLEDREGLRQHRQLTEAADDWAELNKDPGALYRGARLVQAEAWARDHNDALNELEAEFLTESQEMRQQERDKEGRIVREREEARQRELAQANALANRQRWLLIAVSAILLLAIGAGAYIYGQSQDLADTNNQLVASNTELDTERQNAENAADTAQTAEANAVAQQATAEWNAQRAVEARATAEASAIQAEIAAQVAQSRALAAAAQLEAAGNPMRGWLLAIEAGRHASTDQAFAALSLQSPNMTQQLLSLQHNSSVDGAKWNQDESRILTWSLDTARVWDAVSGEALLTLPHDASVHDAIWNQDESRILTSGEDNTARVWDAASGEPLLTLPHDDNVNGAMWNQDESHILTWSLDNTARMWDAASGEPLLTLQHDGAVYSAKWNQDESRILTRSIDNTARVWNAVSGEALSVLPHDSSVRGATWNQDESRILTWSEDSTARVWDAASGKALVALQHDGAVYGAKWNQDESRILTWSLDTARVWDAVSGEVLSVLPHDSSVRGAMWNQDESRILTWSEDSTARVWDAVSGEALLVLPHDSSVNGAMWNQDESRILTWSFDDTARVWNAVSGEPLPTLQHDDSVRGAMWNQDESRILSWSLDNTARVWDAASGEPLLTLPHHGAVLGAKWNQDESRILAWSFDNTARVWDAASGEALLTLPHDDNVRGAMWNKDEGRILTWSHDDTARVWDAASGEPLLILPHDGAVYGAKWNQDESRILSSGEDNTARVWDAASGEPLLTLQHDASVTGAMWNQDESRILTWSLPNTARVWNAVSGEPLLTLPHHGAVFGAKWNRDESHILAWGEGNMARVWDAVSGEALFTLRHDDIVTGATWNQDESRILTWSLDNTARVWDAASGELTRVFFGDRTITNSSQWNMDESQIMLTTDNGKVYRYYTRMDDEIKAACTRATRNLTEAEWQLYLHGEPYRPTCSNLPVKPSVPMPLGTVIRMDRKSKAS